MTTTQELERLMRVPTKEVESFLRQGSAFALQMVQDYGGPSPLPEDGSGLSAQETALLVEAFRASLRQNPSAGEVAEELARLTLYVLARHTDLPERQRSAIQALCAAVAGERPVPALRWADFITANLDNPDRLRRVLTACQMSVRHLAPRLGKVIAGAAPGLNLDQAPTIVAAGYSKTIVAAVKGIADAAAGAVTVLAPEMLLPGKRFSEHELLQEALRSDPRVQVEMVSASRLFQELSRRPVNAALMGCKTLARLGATSAGGRRGYALEVVNSRPAVELGRRLSQAGVPLLVVAGLYKIWPTPFYLHHKDAMVLRPSFGGEPLNGILDQDHISRVLTERGCFEVAGFVDAQVTRWYFDAQDLALPCAISLCTDKKLRQRLDEVDRLLHTLSGGVAVGPTALSAAEQAARSATASAERERYTETGELPQHYLAARVSFARLLADDAWYLTHKGRYVAIMGNDVIDEDSDRVALINRYYDNYGYRPIFTAQVTRERRIHHVSPGVAPARRQPF